MIRSVRWFIFFGLAIAVLSIATPGARRAEAANGWFTGGLVNSKSYTCPGPIVPSMEILGIGAYAGYWTDLTNDQVPIPSGNNPRVGDVFYAKINVTAVGAACQGFGIVPTIRLPDDVNIAIDATNKLRCFYTSDFVEAAFSELSTAECPQQMVLTFDGLGQPVYAVSAPSNSAYYPAWPLACPSSGCGAFEFWIPLVSSQEYNGLLPGAAMVTPVHAIDGWNDPWVYPQVALRVGPGLRAFSEFSTPVLGDNTIKIQAKIVTQASDQGTIYFDIGRTLAYEIHTDSVAIPSAGFCSSGNGGCSAFADWNDFTPGTVYHWRMRYVPGTSGPNGPDTIISPDQVVTTTGVAPADTTPPVVTLIAPAYARVTSIPVTVTATDDRGVQAYGFSESAGTQPAFVSNNPPFNYSFPGVDGGADGSRTVCAWAYDTKTLSVLTSNNNKACKTVVLDRVKPTAALSLPQFAKSNTVAVTATGTDPGGSGVSGFVLSTSNTAPDPLTGGWLNPAPSTFTFPAGGGTKTLYLYSRDKAGNVSLVASANTLIDTAKPAATLALPAFSKSLTVNLTAAGSDTGGSGLNGFRLSTSSTPPAATAAGWVATAPKTFTFPAGDGKRSLFLFTRDKSGNVSAAATDSVFVDTKAPLPKVTVPAKNQALKKLASVSGKVSDPSPGSGIKMGQFAIRKQTGATCTWWHPVQKKFLAGTCAKHKFFALPTTASWSKPAGNLAQAGSYVLFVKFTDKAGNAKLVSVPFTIRP